MKSSKLITMLILIFIATCNSDAAEENAFSADTLPGLARPVQTLSVRSPLATRVHAIFVTEGTVVQAGLPLVQLDDRQAQAKVAMIESLSRQQGRMLQAKADVNSASNTLARLRNVQRKHELAQNEVEVAENTLQKAIATLRIAEEEQKQTELQLELEKLRLAEHTICAPFAGTVIRVSTTRGEFVSQEQELLTVVDCSRLLVDLQIPIEKLKAFEVGKSYQLCALAPLHQELLATLNSIDPVLDSGTGTTRCCFSIENSSLSLPAGFLVLPKL